MNTSDVKPLWALASVVAVIPVMGMIFSVTCHDVSILWASLIGAVIAAVVIPIAFFLILVVSQSLAAGVAVLFILAGDGLRFIANGLRSKKR